MKRSFDRCQNRYSNSRNREQTQKKSRNRSNSINENDENNNFRLNAKQRLSFDNNKTSSNENFIEPINRNYDQKENFNNLNERFNQYEQSGLRITIDNDKFFKSDNNNNFINYKSTRKETNNKNNHNSNNFYINNNYHQNENKDLRQLIATPQIQPQSQQQKQQLILPLPSFSNNSSINKVVQNPIQFPVPATPPLPPLLPFPSSLLPKPLLNNQNCIHSPQRNNNHQNNVNIDFNRNFSAKKKGRSRRYNEKTNRNGQNNSNNYNNNRKINDNKTKNEQPHKNQNKNNNNNNNNKMWGDINEKNNKISTNISGYSNETPNNKSSNGLCGNNSSTPKNNSFNSCMNIATKNDRQNTTTTTTTTTTNITNNNNNNNNNNIKPQSKPLGFHFEFWDDEEDDINNKKLMDASKDDTLCQLDVLKSNQSSNNSPNLNDSRRSNHKNNKKITQYKDIDAPILDNAKHSRNAQSNINNTLSTDYSDNDFNKTFEDDFKTRLDLINSCKIEEETETTTTLNSINVPFMSLANTSHSSLSTVLTETNNLVIDEEIISKSNTFYTNNLHDTSPTTGSYGSLIELKDNVFERKYKYKLYEFHIMKFKQKKLKQQQQQYQQQQQLCESDSSQQKSQQIKQDNGQQSSQSQQDYQKHDYYEINRKLTENLRKQKLLFNKATNLLNSELKIQIINENLNKAFNQNRTNEEFNNKKNQDYFCKNCNCGFEKLNQYLSHLYTDEHLKSIGGFSSTIAVPNLNIIGQNVYLDELKIIENLPLKGVEFLFPTRAFYCSLCDELCDNETLIELHLRGVSHLTKYQELMEQ